mgnify:CR=1 FL=1
MRLKCVICNSEKLETYQENSQQKNILKCKECDIVFTNPTEVSSSSSRYKDGSFWSGDPYNIKKMIQSDFTYNERALNYKSMYSYCRKFLVSGKNILEIGAGSGSGLIMFEKIGFTVTGIEPDSENARLLNDKLINGKCFAGNFEDIKFTEKFDIIWMYHVTEHIPEPDRLLKYCYENLTNNGVVIIAVPDCDNPESMIDSISNPDHIFHFSKHSLEILARNSGFKIEKCDSVSPIKGLSKQRLNRFLKKGNLSFLNKKIWPYYPFQITDKNDGYEIRMILRKPHT